VSGPVLLESVSDGVAALTLNRPERRNALNSVLVSALATALARHAVDDTVRVITLSGAGDDFCSGVDLAELERTAAGGHEASLEDARSLGALLLALRRQPQPVVALLRGRALGGGCALVTACDSALAPEDAELGYPEIHLGFVAALAMVLLRRSVPERVCFELVSSGRRLGAAEAHALGLVSRVFPSSSFETEAEAYVRELASRPPQALRRAKRLLHELAEVGLEEGVERAARVNVEARLSEECREGVRRFLSRGGERPS